MSNKILFFGNERLGTGITTGVPTLQSLVAAGYQIQGVVVAQNEMHQSRNARELEIVKVAAQHNIPILAIRNLSEAKDQLQSLGAEIAVLVAYGKIVPQKIIDIFPFGIINIHPSLLPKHRGPTPIESVILNGDKKTGSSIMRLTNKMDGGAVYDQQEILLKGNETKQYLADQLLMLGENMLLKCLPSILNKALEPKIQNEQEATYDKLITKNVSQLDWNKSAIRLDREIRAYAGWPRSKTLLDGKEIIITQSHIEESNTIMSRKKWAMNEAYPKQKAPQATGIIVESSHSSLGFTTASGILMVDKLIPPGKKEMTTAAFLAGYHPVLA